MDGQQKNTTGPPPHACPPSNGDSSSGTVMKNEPPPFMTLPNELLLDIAEWLIDQIYPPASSYVGIGKQLYYAYYDGSLRDLNHLLRTNRRLAILLEHLLYKHSHRGTVEGVYDYVIHWAAKQGYNRTIEKCLAAKNVGKNVFIVDIVNPDDDLFPWTPLHYAAHAGQTHTVKYLLEAGANPCLFGDRNESALDIAWGSGHDEVVEVLAEAEENHFFHGPKSFAEATLADIAVDWYGDIAYTEYGRCESKEYRKFEVVDTHLTPVCGFVCQGCCVVYWFDVERTETKRPLCNTYGPLDTGEHCLEL